MGSFYNVGGEYLASKFGIVAGGPSEDKSDRINDALNTIGSEGGGRLILDTQGTYYVESPILLSDNTSIEGVGWGCVVMRAFSGGATTNATIRPKLLTGSSNLCIRNLSLSVADDAYTGKSLGFKATAGFNVEQVFFNGTSSDWATAFANCSYGSIASNRFASDDPGEFEDGIHLMGGHDIVISGNYGVTGDDFIALTQENLEESSDLYNIVIVGNSGYSETASLVRLRCLNTTYSIHDITIANNRGTVGAEGLTMTATGSGLPIKRVSIDGYHVNCANNTNSGFYLIGVQDSTFTRTEVLSPYNRAYFIDDCSNLTFDGFSATGSRAAAMQNILVAENDDCADIRFRNGVLADPTTHAIVMGATGAVTGYELSNIEVSATSSSYNGIRLANASKGRVVGNVIDDFANAIVEVGDSDYNQFRDNDVSDCGAGVTVVGVNSAESGTIS